MRLDEVLLRRLEARAAQLGLDRAKYVRGLIEEDLQVEDRGGPGGFVSEDLAGIYGGKARTATNARVREQLKAKAKRRE